MMKPYKYIVSIILAFVILSFSACSNDDLILSGEGKEVPVTFRPTLNNGSNSRAIGDAIGIDRLQVVVYEDLETLSKKFSLSEEWAVVKQDGITLTLVEGHSYKIIFWADDKDNTAYTLTDNGEITVDYTDYVNGGFAKMEEMDAFYGASTITVDAQKNVSKQLELTRPFAQLNFADKAIRPEQGSHKSVVSFHSIPTAFNPFTGAVALTDASDDADDVTFVFEDFPAVETLEFGGATYFYVASNYLLAPSSGSMTIPVTLDLQGADGTSINKFEFKNEKAVTLEKNMKTNVYGNIVQQPETWSVWDGNIPTESTLTTDDENRYVIDEAADIAWLSVDENTNTLEANRTFVVISDIDMAGKTGLSSISLPEGSAIVGNEHTIKGLNLGGGFLDEATNLTISDLVIEDAEISGAESHVGVVVNTLKGSSIFTNVTVKNSSAVTSNGAAGGLIGYIVRKTEKDRNETLEVSVKGCLLNGVTVSGSASEGKFVGLLSGYDNNESLMFDAACGATDVSISDYTSVYTKANNSAWVTSDVTEKYDGWLGAEKYRRAEVTFNGVRLAPKWDGSTATAKADLLIYNNESGKYEVQSPFDLAGVRAATASPSAVYLMENVDMYGQGADGVYNVPSNWTQSANPSEDDNYFKSFSTIEYLDGNGNGIYNLSINTQKVSTSLYYGGFIQSTSGTTTHQNISFHNCCIVVPLVVYKNEDKGSAGVLVSNIAGNSYIMENVHTYGCKVFALQKVGGLAARVAATTTSISNCSVNGCYIENYECKDHPETFSKSAAGVTLSATFLSYGEIGGMFGFVEQNASINNCRVTNTTLYAYGQDDVDANMSGSGWTGKLAVAALKAANYYKVPGRHVGTFIGDIRTTASDGGTITMTNIQVDSNTQCLHHSHTHNNKCATIGRVYFLAYGDEEGTVNYNGTKLELMNCKNNQDRNQ